MPDPDALPDVPQARSAAFLFHGQLIHLGSLPFLTAIAAAFAAPALGDGAWLGITDSAWFTACLVIPVVHQVFVWLGAVISATSASFIQGVPVEPVPRERWCLNQAVGWASHQLQSMMSQLAGSVPAWRPLSS